MRTALVIIVLGILYLAVPTQTSANLGYPYDKWVAESKLPVPTGITVDRDISICPDALACVVPMEGLVHMGPFLDYPEIKRFAFYHELGHVIDFQRGITYGQTERWADLYASCSISLKRRSSFLDYSSPKQYKRRCARVQKQLGV